MTDCITSCLIELQSFTLSKLCIDPIHRVLVSFPLFLHDAGRFGQVKLARIFVFFVHGIHSRKEYCLSLLEICPPNINPEFVMECELIAHPI